jgi:hypothetical protein
MKPTIYEAFGAPGPHIAPDTPVRRWDHGLLYGAIGFVFGFLPLGWWLLGSYNLWRVIHGDPAFFSRIDNDDWLRAWSALALCVITGLAVGGLLAWCGLIPRANTWVVAGPRLLEGSSAIRESRRRSLCMKAREKDPAPLALHPDLVMSHQQWVRHMLIYGGVGSGKTQILLGILKQMFARKHKLLLYDIKGDFTSFFPQASILSPFDARSRVWHVARDVRTPTQAAIFADSMIPEDTGSGKFWSQAARQVLIGAVQSLQNEKPEAWTWSDLAQRVSLKSDEMAPILAAHYPKALVSLGKPDSQTAFNVLATLAGYTRIIDDLARAWPILGDRWMAITDWVLDDYEGPRQIILQAGSDATLTAAYIAALVNILVPAIVSPELPDDDRRFLGIVLDEMGTIGPIRYAPLVQVGRSKGVCFIGITQDLASLRAHYPDHQIKSLMSMVGTHVICQVGMGETRDELSKWLGTNKRASLNHQSGAVVHTDGAPVVYPHELTSDLGFRKTKTPPGFLIRAIVQQGGDLLLLDFPGQPMRVRRKGQKPAAWINQRGVPTTIQVPATASSENRPLDAHDLERIRQQLEAPMDP